MGDWVKSVDRLMLRIRMLIAPKKIAYVDDGGAIQLLQVRSGGVEIIDRMKRVGEYGFASAPLPGCDAIAIFIGGDRSNGAVIATNDQTHRLKNLKPGEVAIFDDQGQKVILNRDGLHIYSSKYILIDVAGYGQKITYTGGTSWHIDNYTDGATVTSTTHSIQPPEIT